MLITQCKTGLNGLTTLKKYNRNFFLYLYFVFQSTLKNISFTSS